MGEVARETAGVLAFEVVLLSFAAFAFFAAFFTLTPNQEANNSAISSHRCAR